MGAVGSGTREGSSGIGAARHRVRAGDTGMRADDFRARKTDFVVRVSDAARTTFVLAPGLFFVGGSDAKPLCAVARRLREALREEAATLLSSSAARAVHRREHMGATRTIDTMVKRARRAVNAVNFYPASSFAGRGSSRTWLHRRHCRSRTLRRSEAGLWAARPGETTHVRAGAATSTRGAAAPARRGASPFGRP